MKSLNRLPGGCHRKFPPGKAETGRGAGAQKEAEGLAYQNQDRSFSSHLAKLEGAVVISNSAYQLSRLRAVADGKLESLGATAESRFFRHRYPVDQGESAYLFISDSMSFQRKDPLKMEACG